MLSLFLLSTVSAFGSSQQLKTEKNKDADKVSSTSTPGPSGSSLPLVSSSAIDWAAVKQHQDWIDMEAKVMMSQPLIQRAKAALVPVTKERDDLKGKITKAEELYKQALARLTKAEEDAKDATAALTAVYAAVKKGGAGLSEFSAAHPLAKSVADAAEGKAAKTPGDLLRDAQTEVADKKTKLESEVAKLTNKDEVSGFLAEQKLQTMVRGILAGASPDKEDEIRALLQGNNKNVAIDDVAQPYVDFILAKDEEAKAQKNVDAASSVAGAVTAALPADFSSL